MASNWQQLSNEISETVAQVGRSVVAVDGRAGHTSSGIVWRSDYILTAAHTVRSETIHIILAPGRSVACRLAGRDRDADIALLKTDDQLEMAPARFAKTSDLSVGELTVAVGRTRRGNIVASAGILSGLMGEWQAGRSRVDQYIRPDLNLYPGFSGGPLVHSTGEVLGLNTGALMRGKPITIPATTLTRIAEEIAGSGQVSRPYIGLVMQPVQIPENLQHKAGVDNAGGLLVMHVEPGGPADTAGVVLGDILVDMDGRAFTELEDVHDALSRKAKGEAVHTCLIRGGQKTDLTIQIGNRPSR